ncbi:hypothetical protein ASF36_24860 [Methylobacterium sp. Leaf90]|nr:hypothetical protein ASF36_24860 [Methylobacterium sp. Leaf90]
MLDRGALQDRHVTVARVLLDPFEGNLNATARAFQHLSKGSAIKHQRAGDADLLIVVLGSGQNLCNGISLANFIALQKVLTGVDEAVEVTHRGLRRGRSL